MVGSFLGLLKLFNCKHFNSNHLKHGTLVVWFKGSLGIPEPQRQHQATMTMAVCTQPHLAYDKHW